MPPTQLLPKRRGQLAPTYAFARHLAIGVGMDGQRPCRTLAEDLGRTQPRAAYPRAAAQTRVVSLAGIRLRSWESARVFKGIICADVSEFESYMPSQAVRRPLSVDKCSSLMTYAAVPQMHRTRR